ncbi:hypothetical protein YC2023_021748 [Brassica napus]
MPKMQLLPLTTRPHLILSGIRVSTTCLLETISIHLWANVEKFDSLHKPNTNTVGIALCEDPEDLVVSQSIFSYKLSVKAGTIMTNSQLPLSQLKAGRSRTTAVRRLLYFWEARDVKKVIELMEIDTVLVDEEELLLHYNITSLFMCNIQTETNKICEEIEGKADTRGCD